MIKGNSILEAVFATILTTYLVSGLFGLITSNIGAVVGAVNGATKGGIGVGIEWVIITGCASILGAWVWHINVVSYLWLGIFAGITGGIAGWITWFIFHIQGTTKKLTPIMVIGYLCAFSYIAVVIPILTEFIFLILFDEI